MNVGPARDTEPEKPAKSPMGALRKRTCPDPSSSPKQPRKKGRFNNTSDDAAALQPSVRENTEPTLSGSGSNVASSVERAKKPGGGVARTISRAARNAKGKAKEDDPGLSIPTKHRQPSETKRVSASQNSAPHHAGIDLGSRRGPYEASVRDLTNLNTKCADPESLMPMLRHSENDCEPHKSRDWIQLPTGCSDRCSPT
jgi:hypothetical protein